MPAKILKILEFDKKIFPINDAVEPNTIKTKEKPKVKKIVLKIIKFSFFFFNLSKEVPEIYEMYPGINGRTHGDKKLINPAKKAIDNVVFINTLMVDSVVEFSTSLFFFLQKILLFQRSRLRKLTRFHKQ